MPLLLRQLTAFLAGFAPLELAESWDNVGLLLGDEAWPVTRVMTCLTLTPDVAEEAVQRNANLIVSHHPVLFRPVQKLTSATTEGRMLLKLLGSQVAVYSPHTAFDSARLGINQLLADRLGLVNTQPLRRSDRVGLEDLGTGRWGTLPQPVTLHQSLNLVRGRLFSEPAGEPQSAAKTPIQYTGDLNRNVFTVGVGCGSAAEFLKEAKQMGCDLFLTGEARFHACLEARESDIALVLAGHYATERPGVESLAEILRAEFDGLETWASEVESDPQMWSVD